MLLNTTLTICIGWTIWAGGVLGVGSTLRFYLRPRINAKLAYQWDGRIIAGKEKEDLPEQITAALRELDYPYTSTTAFAIWNPGKQVVLGLEVAAAKPIRVELGPKDRFLRIRVQSRTNEVNSIQVRTDPERPNVALFSLDRLDPGDGVRVDMLHTGLGYALQLAGTFRGAPNEISNRGRITLCGDNEKPSWWVPYAPHMAVIVSILLALFPLRLAMHHGQRAHWFLLTGGSGILMNLVSFVGNSWVVVTTGLAQFRRNFGQYPKSLRTLI